MQFKVFILSFISLHRFWRTGDWLVEIQNIYVNTPCLQKKRQEWKRTSFIFPVRCRTLLLRPQQSVQGTNPNVEFVLGHV